MFDFLNDEDEKEEPSEFEKSDKNRIKNLKNPFHGLLANEIKCRECSYSNEIRQTSFTCLTLSLCDNIHSNLLRSVYLKERMNAFEKEEEIDGYRCMLCECNGLIRTLRGMKVDKMSKQELYVLEEQYVELNEKLNK